MPGARLELLSVAAPVASRFAVPMEVPSAEKVTAPVGMPPLPVTFAVMTTGESTVAGLGRAVTAVDEVAIATVNGSGEDALPASLRSPE